MELGVGDKNAPPNSEIFKYMILEVHAETKMSLTQYPEKA
jgi:hypothetical protein